MSLNQVYEIASPLHVPVPAGTKSGDPVLLGGNLPGCALTTRDANGEATVKFEGGWRFKVIAKNGAGNSAIAVGDKIFIEAEGKLSKIATGTLFGFAVEPAAAGSEGEIVVKLSTP